jgi:opacity protein-like surface antigen
VKKKLWMLLAIVLIGNTSLLAINGKIGILFGDDMIASSRYHDVYGNHSLFYGLSLTCLLSNHFEINTEIIRFSKKGEDTLDGASFSLLTISLVPEWIPSTNGTIRPYIAMGLLFAFGEEKTPYYKEGKNNFGFSPEVGTVIQISGKVNLKMALSYRYLKIKPFDDEVDLSGLQVKLGIGFQL